MENNTKQHLIVTVAGVSLFVALMNLSDVLGFAGKLINLILPVIVGAILALFINVPTNGIEKRLKWLCKKSEKKPSEKRIHIFSFVFTLICILLVLFLVLTLLIPELVRSCRDLYKQTEASIPRWIAYLNDNHAANIGWLEEWISEINWEQAIHNIFDGVDAIFVNIAGALSSTVNVVATAGFAIIISIYIVLEKGRLCKHAKTLVCAYLKPVHAENILRFCRLFVQSFANFLTGQCSEAVILGILMFFAFVIFRLPYGSLVGVLTAICAIIPYVGAFISCFISVFLVLLIDPTLAIRCLIVYLVVQFIENQFIYPRVVGGSVGLSPFYTLIAAMIGGKLLGIIGILFFIPLAAVVIELVKEDAGRRLSRRKNRVFEKL